jgi:hypothetical protein
VPVLFEPALGVAALLLGAPEADPTVRRVCVQMGVSTHSAPDRKARIARSRSGPPSRLGGGEYVQLTGARAPGYHEVSTLGRATLWIPDTAPESGHSSLCLPASTTMRVCPIDGATPDVPVLESFDRPTAAPVASVRRGSLVRVFEYFEDRGRWAFVEIGGKSGFVRSEDLCLEATTPPGLRATERFRMIAAPARSACYQSNRERGRSEIRRIVIHNSESSMRSAIATFQDCDPARPTSAHVGIDREGRMYRFVEDRFAAFHTGASHGGFNAVSLGIELVASEHPAQRSMTPPQERALVALIAFWAEEYHITPARAGAGELDACEGLPRPGVLGGAGHPPPARQRESRDRLPHLRLGRQRRGRRGLLRLAPAGVPGTRASYTCRRASAGRILAAMRAGPRLARTETRTIVAGTATRSLQARVV